MVSGTSRSSLIANSDSGRARILQSTIIAGVRRQRSSVKNVGSMFGDAGCSSSIAKRAMQKSLAPWYRAEDYPLIREIMDDGAKSADTFEGWKRAADHQLAEAAAQGVNIQTVILDLEEFVAYCDEMKLPRGSGERSKFVEWARSGRRPRLSLRLRSVVHSLPNNSAGDSPEQDV
jgi:hypothetical protein